MATACPKCGGEQGYTYRIPCYILQVRGWDNRPDANDAEICHYPSQRVAKTVICLDCGARIPRRVEG